MVSQEIKKYMFENCPKIWEQFVNNEVSKEYLMLGYELQKSVEETEKKGEELEKELLRQLHRGEKLNRLHDLLHQSIEIDAQGVAERMYLN